jgi:hypothetical protein
MKTVGRHELEKSRLKYLKVRLWQSEELWPGEE